MRIGQSNRRGKHIKKLKFNVKKNWILKDKIKKIKKKSTLKKHMSHLDKSPHQDHEIRIIWLKRKIKKLMKFVF